MSCQGQVMAECCPRDHSIPKRRTALLTKPNGLGTNRLRHRKNFGGVEKLVQEPFFLLPELMLAKRFDLAHDRYGRNLASNERSQRLPFRSRGVNNQVAVKEHGRHQSRPGSGRSCRISRCHSLGSSTALKASTSANLESASAIRRPRCSRLTGSSSSTVTCTRSGRSVVGLSSPTHRTRPPSRTPSYV